MINYQPLNQFPDELKQQFLSYFEDNFKGKEPEQKWSNIHHASEFKYDDLILFFKKFPIKPYFIELFYVNSGIASPHIDRGRKSALQIPIQVNDFKAYVSKYKDYSCIPVEPGTFSNRSYDIIYVNDCDNYFFKYNDTDYDLFDINVPTIQNVSVPHGGINYSSSTCIFVSVSFLEEFDLLKDMLKEWI